jgi:hypothetical protein
MLRLRFPAVLMFGLLLAGCAVMDIAEASGVMDGVQLVCLDFEGEESEESEEEREGPEEKEGEAEFEAMLASRHSHNAIGAHLRHGLAPSNALKEMVIARIWEPPELG